MHLKYRNINDCFYGLVSLIDQGDIPTVRRSSRVGNVLQIEEPMTITYSRPKERVLFNVARDQNCFMTLFESLWMLAGRRDIAPVAYYSSNYAKQVQDGDDPNANGAYGYRWRHNVTRRRLDDPTLPGSPLATDQLEVLINHLRAKPDSRRAVLQMWNIEDDLLKIDSSKDVCCNLCCCFSIRTKVEEQDTGGVNPWGTSISIGVPVQFLDMTVFNRSNDLIWGALGANVVHFSFLQEYVAACLGVEVGVYNQITNNLHVYLDNWKPDEWLDEWKGRTQLSPPLLSYETSVKLTVPLVSDPAVFDREVARFVDEYGSDDNEDENPEYREPFLRDVAEPMCIAFYWHKQRDYTAANVALDLVKADDWRIAGRNWIEKRRINWEAKNVSARVE